MFLAYVVAGIRDGGGRACALGLLIIVVALVPLADASPPDPAWIPGIYDDADFDEVVVAVVSAMGLVGTLFVLSKPANALFGAVRPRVTVLCASASCSIFSIRAPPSRKFIAAT